MRVFVYGTLTDPDRVASVVDTFEFVGDATLVGLHRVEGRYPTLAPGGETDGKLLHTPDVSTLDAYEGVERRPYCRVTVRNEVTVYVGNPDKLDTEESISWPGNGPFENRVQRFVEEADIQVRMTE